MDEKVVWTDEADEQLFNVLDYWKNRTQSYSYPIKIKKELDQRIQIILQNPLIGKESEIPGVRSLNFLKYFKIIYGIYKDQLVILNFWDMRQDPEENPFL
ncbi:type II toxin-antitoxin system RelE/ParE family toxin [Aquiflexum sp.]|uniref:type II toxin-antitoxin system RelE/ParE family toxin n=1 Tax=Aquiflexum sp. TaxID=1872584 RepID=UPI0035948D38